MADTGTPGTPGRPGVPGGPGGTGGPGGPGGVPSGTGGAGGTGGTGGPGGGAGPNWPRIILLALAALAFIAGGAAFAVAISQNRAINHQLAQETHAHCLVDTRQDNQRRALSLGLLQADRAELAALHHELPTADRTGTVIIAAQIRWLNQVVAVRTATIPAYVDPAHC